MATTDTVDDVKLATCTASDDEMARFHRTEAAEYRAKAERQRAVGKDHLARLSEKWALEEEATARVYEGALSRAERYAADTGNGRSQSNE